jgi:hypothetical protein
MPHSRPALDQEMTTGPVDAGVSETVNVAAVVPVLPSVTTTSSIAAINGTSSSRINAVPDASPSSAPEGSDSSRVNVSSGSIS